MTEFLNIFKMIFDWFSSLELFGIPILVIVLGTALLWLIMSFIKGKKE